MSRHWTYSAGSLAANTLSNVLTVPSGHYYEIGVVAFGPNNGLANWLQVLAYTSAATRYIDTYRLASTEGAKSFFYNSLVLKAGDVLQLRSIPASGSAAVPWYASYVDVDTTT